MEQVNKEKTYIEILCASLEKKNKLLDELLLLTQEQKVILHQQFEESIFNDILDKKEKIFREVERLDEGFDSIYQQVKIVLTDKKEAYQQEILKMQNLIRTLTDKSAKIQVLELQNKERFLTYIQDQRGKLRDFNKSHRSLKNYYNNTSSQYSQESVFFDKKN